MESFVLYDIATGRIAGMCTGDMEGWFLNAGQAVLAVDQASDVRDYVDGLEVVPRPDSGISLDKTAIDADGVDEATVSGIPAGSLVEVDGEVVEVTDGTLELSSDANTVFFISIEPPFPFISWSATVTAS